MQKTRYMTPQCTFRTHVSFEIISAAAAQNWVFFGITSKSFVKIDFREI